MKLELAKCEMLCSSCGVRIEAGSDWHDSGVCVGCIKRGKPSPASIQMSTVVDTAPPLFNDPERELLANAADELGRQVLNFKGATYNPKRDQIRLTKQALRIFQFMREHDFVTLREIAEGTGDPEASISARIRSFKVGGHDYEKRIRAGSSGLWEYKLHPKDEQDNKAA